MEYDNGMDAGAAEDRAGTVSDPRWLDSEELEAWVQLAMILTHVPAGLDAQLTRDANLTHFEYEVLSVLSDAPERSLRMSSLATLAGGSQSRLSHVVKRMEKRGWIDRVPCPDDRRVTYARLTDDGYAEVVSAAPGYVDNVRRLVIDRLSRRQLRELIGIGRSLNDAVQRLP